MLIYISRKSWDNDDGDDDVPFRQAAKGLSCGNKTEDAKKEVMKQLFVIQRLWQKDINRSG